MAESIFAFNLRRRFFLDMRFQQSHKGHYGAWFKPIKSIHQWHIFLRKIQKSLFSGSFGQCSQNEIFSQKSGSVSFLPSRHRNIRSFRKILWAVLEKTRLVTDKLTYWQWWNHNTPFRRKAGIQLVTELIKTTAPLIHALNR